jgi:integrase/recombinase XerD
MLPMFDAPIITIYVRHSVDCPHIKDETHAGCRCRKHFRWWVNGKLFRQAAKTRSWKEAEQGRARLLAQMVQGDGQIEKATSIAEAIRLFQSDKKNQGITQDVLNKYNRELTRLQAFAEKQNAFTVKAVSQELLIGYQEDWLVLYPSSQTRASVQARLKHFLRFCFESGWLDRPPKLTKIRVDESPTLPLTDKEYEKLLKTIPKVFTHPPYPKDKATTVHALVQLMRWTGLAIRDAVTLERNEIQLDDHLYRITTSRQKTGTHVSIPIRPEVAQELLAVLNGNPKYVFWSGNGLESSTVTHWQDDMRTLFNEAGIKSEGHMRSHRLRDTFAVDLLQKGVPLEEVSKLLGHDSIKTTEKSYAKWVKSRQDRLDKLVMATW